MRSTISCFEHTPTPVVALNRAVALAEVEGPDAALDAIAGLDLEDYHLYHATRADLLTRLGRRDEAALAYDSAIRLTSNAAERELLERRRSDSRQAPGTSIEGS